MHSNAWSQGLILVIHDRTRITSDIEELISRSNPSLEDSVMTFNCPKVAAEFAKGRADIRLCIIKDYFKEISGIATFDNIKIVTSNESHITPVAVLIYDESPNIEIYRKITKRREILEYISHSSFSASEEKTKQSLKLAFDEYKEFIDELTSPFEVSNILFDLCSKEIRENFRIKYDRVSTIVMAQLNLSAAEHSVVKWLPYLENIDSNITSLENPHSLILKISKTSSGEGSDRLKMIQSYCHELKILAQLDASEVEKYMAQEKADLRPSSRAIKKAIVKNSEKIINIFRTVDTEEVSELRDAS